MALSDQAIGFYLQMEDRMTPQLPAALSAYQKFVGSMEKLNRKAFEGTSGLFANLSQLVKGATRVATGSAMKVNLEITRKSKRNLTGIVSDAVSRALAGTKFRFRASMPKRVLGMFSQDASLKTLYSGMPQPPDMVGGIQKFAKGGKVSGKGATPNKDSVLGLLTPGEVVIPTDLVKKIEDAFEKVEATKGMIAAGFGSAKEQKLYNKAIKELATAMDTLADKTKGAGLQTRMKLAPQIVNLRNKMKELTAAEQKAEKEADDLLGRALAPTRFIAIIAAIKTAKEGFNEFTNGVSQFGQQVGVGEFQSFPERLREIRQRLGLTAEEATTFTQAIGESADAVGTNFFDAMKATDALIEAGVKDRKLLIEQSALLARANRVTGADFNELAKASFYYRTELKGSAEGFDALILSIDKMTKSTDLAVNTPELMQALTESLNNPILKDAGPAAIQNYANNLLGLKAAAATVFEGDKGIEKMFADALSGNAESLKQVSLLTGGSIDSYESLRNALTQKDGLINAFKGTAAAIEAQRAQGLTMEAIGQQMGVDGKFLARMNDFITAQKTAAGLAVPLEDSATAGDKLGESMDKMSSAAEKLTNAVSSLVGGSAPLQMVLEVLDQIPVVALLAGAHLGGSLLRSILALGSGITGVFGSVFSLFGKFGGMFGKLGMAGGAAGGLGAVGGTAGGAGLMAIGLKVGGIMAVVGAVLLLVGKYADDILPILQATVPGLMKLGKYIVEELGTTITDTVISLTDIFRPLSGISTQIDAATTGLLNAAKMLGSFALVFAELSVLGTAAVLGGIFSFFVELFGAGSPLEILSRQAAGMATTITSMVTSFAPIGAIIPTIEQARSGLNASAKFLGSFLVVFGEMGLLTGGAAFGELTSKFLSLFGVKSPMEALREQSASIADTLLVLTEDLQRLTPIGERLPKVEPGLTSAATFMGMLYPVLQQAGRLGDAAGALGDGWFTSGPLSDLRTQTKPMVATLLGLTEDLMPLNGMTQRLPTVQPGIDSATKFMAMLHPMLLQTKRLGDAASMLGDGWFTTGPLSNLKEQAEPMIGTITDLGIWFSRVPINPKAIAGLDYTQSFFTKLASTVGVMQQVGAVDAASIRKAASAMLDVKMTQPTAAPALSKEQIDQVLQVAVSVGEQSPLHKDIQETNELLRQLILVTQQRSGEPPNFVSSPRAATTPTRTPNKLLTDIVEFNR